MKIVIQTQVSQHFLKVKDGFNESLFKELSPSFPPVKLARFDGSSKGDIVSLELSLFLFKQKWTSEIIEDQTNSNEFFFIDKGIELPFFLKTWVHKHRIINNDKGSVIRDEINYEAPFAILTLLLYPVLYLQFSKRKPIYKKIFKN